MKLLVILFHLLGMASSHILPANSANVVLYQPNGSIIGDFTNITTFPPKVILNFLAACSNVTLVESDDCLVSTFAKLRVHRDLHDTLACESCSSPPNINQTIVEASARNAQQTCNATDKPASMSEVLTLTSSYMTILSSPCWDSLRQDDAFLHVESRWIKSCAHANLPYPIPVQMLNLFTVDSVLHRSHLTCMLDNFFDADPAFFGLPPTSIGSPESCLVPGYANLTSTCASFLAPKVYQKCSANPENPAPMSMDYTGTDEAIFLEEFCEILDTLNTNTGRKCLMDLCAFDPTESPSEMPSDAPSTRPTQSSSQPSPSPTSKPSISPAPFPSTLHSLVPTIAPSLAPSTKGPSSAPDSSENPQSPVGSPTKKPSPSMSPSLLIKTPLPSKSTSRSPSSLQPSMLSKKPTLSPNQLTVPSVKPTLLPTPTPSESAMPSIDEVRAVVTVEILAVVTLNVSLNEVPADDLATVFHVLEEAIENVVGGSSLVTVRPVSQLGGSRVLLTGNSTDFDVNITAARDCQSVDCDAFGVRVVQDLEESFRKSISAGELDETVQSLASVKRVELLQNASFHNLRLLDSTVTTEAVAVDVPENQPAPTSAAVSSPLFSSLAVIAFFSLLL